MSHDILIIYYSGDTAGSNISKNLREIAGCEMIEDGLWRIEASKGRCFMIESGVPILYLDPGGSDVPGSQGTGMPHARRDFFDKLKNLRIEFDVCIVASKHRSESARPTLTCHAPGNFSDNKMGGRAQELSIAPAHYISGSLVEIKNIYTEQIREGAAGIYDISLEVTHHGPTSLQMPVVFVEVGSDMERWQDRFACGVISRAIKNIINSNLQQSASSATGENDVAVGFGGTHYAPNFTKAVLKRNISIGHIMPKYALENISENSIKPMIVQMIKKTSPEPDFALIDWKGLNSLGKNTITKILDDAGVEWKRCDKLV